MVRNICLALIVLLSACASTDDLGFIKFRVYHNSDVSVPRGGERLRSITDDLWAKACGLKDRACLKRGSYAGYVFLYPKDCTGEVTVNALDAIEFEKTSGTKALLSANFHCDTGDRVVIDSYR